jgi:lysophospholipase L1-like esterase
LGSIVVLLWSAVLGPLTGELWLVLQRRSWAGRVAEYAERNGFAVAQRLSLGAAPSLWEKPGRRYRPGAELSFRVGTTLYQVRINSRGFRTQEFEERKTPKVFRVICVGASTTLQGRTNQETYPALLQQRMDRLLGVGRVEVLNLGINGTRTDYWLRRSDELFRYQPDLVIQYAFVNDFYWGQIQGYADGHPLRSALNRSLLFSWLFPSDPRAFDSQFLPTLRNLRRLARQARAHGAQYLTATFSGPDARLAPPAFRAYLDQNTEAWGQALHLHYYRDYDACRRRFNLQLRAFCAARRMNVVPVAETIREPPSFVDICHMTPPGIEQLADVFVPAVREGFEWYRATHEAAGAARSGEARVSGSP